MKKRHQALNASRFCLISFRIAQAEGIAPIFVDAPACEGTILMH
jgi:hypothetical protein